MIMMLSRFAVSRSTGSSFRSFVPGFILFANSSISCWRRRSEYEISLQMINNKTDLTPILGILSLSFWFLQSIFKTFSFCHHFRNSFSHFVRCDLTKINLTMSVTQNLTKLRKSRTSLSGTPSRWQKVLTPVGGSFGFGFGIRLRKICQIKRWIGFGYKTLPIVARFSADFRYRTSNAQTTAGFHGYWGPVSSIERWTSHM